MLLHALYPQNPRLGTNSGYELGVGFVVLNVVYRLAFFKEGLVGLTLLVLPALLVYRKVKGCGLSAELTHYRLPSWMVITRL